MLALKLKSNRKDINRSHKTFAIGHIETFTIPYNQHNTNTLYKLYKQKRKKKKRQKSIRIMYIIYNQF